MPDKPRDIEADAIALLEIARERGGNLPWVRATIADGLRSRAAALRAEADAEAGRLEALADKIAGGGLTVTRPTRIVRSMDVDTTGRSGAVKRGAARATRKHPAQRRLYEVGLTITDVARELREGRPRVSAWFAEGDANRPIPRRHAEYLRDRYQIPISAWARVAD